MQAHLFQNDQMLENQTFLLNSVDTSILGHSSEILLFPRYFHFKGDTENAEKQISHQILGSASSAYVRQVSFGGDVPLCQRLWPVLFRDHNCFPIISYFWHLSPQ